MTAKDEALLTRCLESIELDAIDNSGRLTRRLGEVTGDMGFF
jgi:hypothetical protein